MAQNAPQFRTLGLWLVACALALRLVIAPGFMLVAGPDGVTISMCTGKGAVSVFVPGEHKPAMPETGCAFASLAVATTPDLPAVVAPPALLLLPVAAPLTQLVRRPHIGVPAPPPPAIGPPLLI